MSADGATLLCAETADEFGRIVRRCVESIKNSLKDDSAYSGPAPLELKEIISRIEILPEEGLGFDSVMETLDRAVMPNFLRTSSPNYMAHLHGPALLESIGAELILSAFNQSMDSWDQSPVATEVEVAVVRTLCSIFGFGMGDGCFASGGSQSNLTGILLARDWFCNEILNHDVKKLGLPQNFSKFRLYANEKAHFSMEKSCHLLGLGYGAVAKVPVDARQKMDVDALRSMILRDKAQGLVPFCVAATIGTTDFGSIDDVERISSVAKEFGLWLHADAAYGGGLLLSEKYAARAGRLSLCDSITVDFHKMFLLPISCSAILTRRNPGFAPLELHADYLNREEDEEEGYTNLVGKSMQTTRRFDALKVMVAFMARGRRGYARIIDAAVENAAYAYEKICGIPLLEPACEPEISSVVFRAKRPGLTEEGNDALNRKIRRTLMHEDGIVIGQTTLEGRVRLKFTLLNPRITRENLDSIIKKICELAQVV